MPAVQPATAWVIVPVAWRKATWSPSGACWSPVNPLPLAETPEPLLRAQLDKGPGSAGRVVLEVARPHRRRLEPRVADRHVRQGQGRRDQAGAGRAGGEFPAGVDIEESARELAVSIDGQDRHVERLAVAAELLLQQRPAGLGIEPDLIGHLYCRPG